MEGAIELDEEVKAAAAKGQRTPHDGFSAAMFRQPSLNEGKLKPSLYRHHKPMLPETVYGPRPADIMGGGGGGGGLDSMEAGTGVRRRGTSNSPISPMHQFNVNSPLPAESAHSEVEGSNEDDYDESEDAEKDVDAAVDELLEDENRTSAVNVISTGVSALRRNSVMGFSVSGVSESEPEGVTGAVPGRPPSVVILHPFAAAVNSSGGSGGGSGSAATNGRSVAGDSAHDETTVSN